MNPKTETKATAAEISLEEALKRVTDTITMYIDECKITTKRSVELNLNACMGMDEDEKNKEEYKVHAYNRNCVCAVGFMDDLCSVRSVFYLLNQFLDEYQKSFGETWRSPKEDSSQPRPYLTEALNKFQNIQVPAEADKLLKIQRVLDEAKLLLHNTIESVLDHGENLDSLEKKISDLSMASQMFYKREKKTNSCCSIVSCFRSH